MSNIENILQSIQDNCEEAIYAWAFYRSLNGYDDIHLRNKVRIWFNAGNAVTHNLIKKIAIDTVIMSLCRMLEDEANHRLNINTLLKNDDFHILIGKRRFKAANKIISKNWKIINNVRHNEIAHTINNQEYAQPLYREIEDCLACCCKLTQELTSNVLTRSAQVNPIITWDVESEKVKAKEAADRFWLQFEKSFN